MVAILDGRFAAEGIDDKAESGHVFVLFVSFQIEHSPIVWASQLTVEPTKQLPPGPHLRHALVLDCGENGAADQNLPSCIALPFTARSTGDEAALLSPYSRQPFIERLNSRSHAILLSHTLPPVRRGSMQREYQRGSVRNRH
jgi:hypothetical protein